MILLTDYLARIGCAFLMGTLIGVERQFRQRNAGLRTNILVSVGAAAFTVLSYAMTEEGGRPLSCGGTDRIGHRLPGWWSHPKGWLHSKRTQYRCHDMVLSCLRYAVGCRPL